MLTPEQAQRLEEARQRQQDQQIENERIATTSFVTWLYDALTNTARSIDPRKLADKYLRDFRNRKRRT
jgi:hypothetical protein